MFAASQYYPILEMNYICIDGAFRPRIPQEIIITGRVDLDCKLEPMEYELSEPTDTDLQTIHMEEDDLECICMEEDNLESSPDHEMEDLECCEVENIQNDTETFEIDLEMEYICMGIAFVDIEDEDWDEL